MSTFILPHAAAPRSVRSAALASLSLFALAAGTSTVWAQASARLDEITVQGAGAAAGAGIPTSIGARSLPGGAPASTILRPGQVPTEDPKGPVDGFVAKRSSTATKTNTPLLETPQSISVVGQEQIRATGAQNLAQATQYVPGIYSGAFGVDARLDFFQLRGFVASDYGLYKDGLQLLNYGFNYFRTDTFGLERIEVLRGPSSLLFGSGNPGGMINMITKRPTLVPFNYVEAGVDSFGQGYGAFDFGGPADDSGHWFYRLTGVGRAGGTQIDGVDADRVYIAPSLTYRPDGATSFTMLTSYQKDWTGVTANFLPYYGTVVPNASGLFIPRSLNVGDAKLNTFRREQFFLGYEFESAVDEVWTIRQNLRYSFSEAYQNSFIGQLGYAFGTNETQLARYQFRDSSRVGLFQVDNQAQADFSDGLFRHTAIFGLDYKNYTLHDNQASAFPAPSLDILNPVYAGSNLTPVSYLIDRDKFQQLGFYAQDQVKITDNFSIIAGLRGDFASTSVDKQLFGTDTSRNDQAVTYRLAGVYNFDFGLAPYIAYSTSFQPQIGFDALAPGNPAFRPDRGKQLEAGFRYQPIGQGWLLSFAAFDLQRDNPLIPVAPGITSFTQLGAVNSQGVEAQFVANLFEGLNVTASVTHFDIKYTSSQQVPSLVGRTPTGVPETLANFFADYTIPHGELRGLGFGGGVRYVGRSFAVDSPQAGVFTVPDYLLYDATVHYDFGNGIRAAITGSNLGDKRFVTACQDLNNCYYGEARRVLGTVSYKW